MRRLYLPVVALLAASCHDSTSPGPISDLDAIQISTRVDPPNVVAGATANVVLTLRNASARPVEISACPIYFWVQDADGQIVGGSKLLYCVAGTLVYLPLRLKPFETKTLPFTWLVGETQAVPPGPYDVFGWVNDPAHRSAPVPITVEPANAPSSFDELFTTR